MASRSKKNSLIRRLLKKAGKKISQFNIPKYIKEQKATSKSKSELRKIRIKLLEKIREEKKTPASLETQAERNKRRKNLGISEPSLKFQGIYSQDFYQDRPYSSKFKTKKEGGKEKEKK